MVIWKNVFMDGYLDEWMDGWMVIWMNEWMDGYLDEWMDSYYECMDGCLLG